MIKSTELVHFRKISNLIKFVFSFDLAFCEELGGGGGGGVHPILCECWCCDRDPGGSSFCFSISLERESAEPPSSGIVLTPSLMVIVNYC
jgi:hypothetical protein